MHNRENALKKWLNTIYPETYFKIKPLAGDASFRRYFRLELDNTTQIIMDAPPKKEGLLPFVNIGKTLSDIGVITPKIHAINYADGFAILDDLGDTLFLNALSTFDKDLLYITAMHTLCHIHQKIKVGESTLPIFDKDFILAELSLFQDWFLKAYLNMQLTSAEIELLKTTFTWLCQEIMQQPQVFVHRDYHSRNLMILDQKNDAIKLGVIDFQDAMLGPITYDLVSLLKDCYVKWPEEQITQWLLNFYQLSAIEEFYSFKEFSRAFHICGLQRHLKVLGIFSRLHLRDNKSNYLNDLPLTLNYVMESLQAFEELKPFYNFMQRIHLP